ncbi:MAG: glycosyltransferase family 4 protein [Thermodesulfobacteriota bacterium]
MDDLNVDRRRDIIKPSYLIVLIFLLLLLLPRVRWTLHEIGERWTYILFLSFSLSFCLTPIAKKAALRFGVLDIPDKRKLHSFPVPFLGGVGIFTAFLIAVYLNGIYTGELIGVIISAFLIFVAGLLDDVWGLSSLFRLVVQILAVLLLVSFGVSVVIFKPEGVGLILNTLVTLIWIVGITNSMNFFDGMDGLAAGLSLLIAVFLGVVAFQTSQPFLGWLAIAVAGSCLGFMPYNFRIRRKATIFLGDSGSNFLGFTLASLAVMGEWSDRSLAASLATPVLIFSILIYDMIYITINRFLTGKVRSVKEWLDYVGRDHLHHRMETILQSRRKSVLFIYLLSFTLSINALILRGASTVEAWLLLLQAAAILIVVTIFEIVVNRGQNNHG